MNKPPAFQFYASDWLGSSQIALMSAEQERGYLRLLLHQWSSPGCCLPDDDEVLSRLSMMGEGWFTNGSHLVRRCFVPNPDQPGTIRNEKLYQVYLKQVAWRAKSAEGGRKSGESRKLHQTEARRVVEPPHEANTQPKGNTPVSSLHNIPPNPLLTLDVLVEAWNKLPGARKTLVSNQKRKAAFNTRMKEPFFVEHWKDAIAKFPLKCFSDNGGWRPDIDWFLRPGQVAKILEGAFDWVKTPKQPEVLDSISTPVVYANQ